MRLLFLFIPYLMKPTGGTRCVSIKVTVNLKHNFGQVDACVFLSAGLE